jgi:lysophospholipase L1-like esterase
MKSGKHLPLSLIFSVSLLLTYTAGWSQVKIMPVGNSITWGKLLREDPAISGTHGYRDHLFNALINANISARFVGPQPGNPMYDAVDYDPPYEGYYKDGRQIGQLLPDSSASIRVMLDNMPLDSLPDYIILHIGSNDMAQSTEIGDHETPGTVMYRLYRLMDVLLNYSRGGHTFKKIYLCKIIPKGENEALGLLYPDVNARIETFNARIQTYWESRSLATQNRIELVDMHTEFYAKMTTYFTVDVDPTHPNTAGYQAMAEKLFSHVLDDVIPGENDDFNRAVGPLNNSNRWRADSNIQLSGMSGQSYDGVIYNNDLGSNWDNLAVWPKSSGANTIEMTFHANSTNFNTVAMAVALDDTVPNQADGYMVWISGGQLRVWTIQNGQAGNNALSSLYISVPQYSGGDKFTVNYRTTADKNYFDISINGVQVITAQHTTVSWGKTGPFYAGVLFKGQSGLPTGNAAMVTNFLAKAAPPDPVKPGQILYFEAVTADYNSISLRWDATGDDGQIGTASRYDLRISTSPMNTDEDISNADVVSGLPQPFPSGTRETFKVRNLKSGQRYWLAIRAIDDWGNLGPWSDVIDMRTTVREPQWYCFDDLNEMSYSPTDYGIDNRPSTAGEFTNIRSTGTFPQTVAVYKGATNPSTVKIVWGNEVTYGAPNAVDNGGFALMLNDDQPNADGYALFIRTVTQSIYLWTISNGGADELIDAVPYIIKDNSGDPVYPDDDDTLEVVIDWENAAYNRFDVFVNGEAAGERALYDSDKRHTATGNKFAGLFLSGMYGLPGRNNNVACFGTISEICYETEVEQLPVSVPQAEVKSVLTNPAQLRVLDCNQNPKQGWPVYFWLADNRTGGSITAPPTVNDPIRIEAEWGRVVQNASSIDIPDHHLASRGKYVEYASGSSQSGYVEWDFYVAEAGDYYFWARVVARAWNSSILWVQLDGSPANLLDGQYWSLDTNWSTDDYDFRWDRVRFNKGLPFHRNLQAGLHTLRIYKGHNGVKLDKLLITRNSTYQPIGVDSVLTKFTDINGLAGTDWTLGEKTGANILQARIFGKDDIYDWQITGLSAVPYSMTPTENTTIQSGPARSILTLPLEVTVYDVYGNVTPNVSISWFVEKGDGIFTLTSAQTCTTMTDANGKTATPFKLGIMDSTNTVKATFTGYTGSTQFMGNVTSGLIKDIQVISPIKAKHYVGDILPNHVKVKIIDDKDQAVQGVPVHFEVTQGNALTGKQPKMTAVDGTAQDTLTYGPTSSVVHVQARVSTLTKEIFVDSVYYKASKVRLFAGQNGVAQLGDTLKQRIKVQVVDRFNRGLANHPVKFKTRTPRDHGWKFTGDKDSVLVYTGLNGVASTNIRAGQIHGAYVNLVEAYATDGFFPLTGEPTYPVKFTLHAQSNASILQKFSNDSTEGVVNERLPDPIVVKMLNNQNPPQPVAYQPVTFTIEAGGGRFEGQMPQDPDTTVFTNGEGLASVDLFLGPVAGLYNNIVKVTATNGVTSLYPPGGIFYHFSAKSSNADTLIRVSEQNVTGTVAKPMEKSIQVKVKDATGNGVPGVSVTFSVLSGGGSVGNGADTTLIVTTQTTEGVASVKWKLGPKAGTNNNSLKAEAFNGLVSLKGSPLLFYGSGTADIVNKDSSSISTSGSYVASGQDTCWITVTLLDRYRNPVMGKYIKIKVTGGTNYYDTKIGPTSSAGKAMGHLISPNSGMKVIEAIVEGDNVLLTQKAVVNFDPNNAARIQPIFGSGQIGNVGTVSKDSLAVKVTDLLGNPVANKRVYFQVTSEKGGSVTQSEVITDVDGIAATYLIFGSTSGEYTVQAVCNDPLGNPLDGSPALFTTVARVGQPVSMFLVSGDKQEGPAGKILPKQLTVGVRDGDGQPVANVGINFTVAGGSGQVVTPNPVMTNMYGYAQASLRADTQMGATTIVKASAAQGVLSGSPVTFTAKSTQAEAARLVKVSGDGQSGNVGETLTDMLVVKVTDIFGNPVQGKSVTFDITSGEASFGGQPSVTTLSNSSGNASASLTLGNQTGLIAVEVNSTGLEGSPLYFTATVTTVQAAQLIAVSNLNLTASTNGTLPGSIKVRVLDEYGNGVPDISVYFSKDTGEGQIVDAATQTETGDQFVWSNENGLAAIQFKTGPNPGVSRIRAVSGIHTVQFIITVNQNASLPVLNKAIISDTYTIRENDQLNPLNVILSANDADGDALTFEVEQAGAASIPVNMSVAQQTSLTALIRWIPGVDDEGIYNFIARVVDSHGGYDQKAFTVAVINSPQPPEIIAHIPAAADTQLFAGLEHHLWIGARDPDGDPLTYSWKLNGQSLNNSSSLLIWHIPSNLSGNYTLTATVSDGLLSDIISWNIEIIVTAVELTEFFASFDPFTGFVQVNWAANQEKWTSGYEIYRSTREDGEYVLLTTEKIQPNEERTYSFIDINALAGVRYFYKLVDIDHHGLENSHGPVAIEVPKPDAYVLHQNYPNPFNPLTTIRFEVPKREHVKIIIYNMRGQEVVTLVDEIKEPGYFKVEWNGCDTGGIEVSTGLYLYRLQSLDKVITKRLVKMK